MQQRRHPLISAGSVTFIQKYDDLSNSNVRHAFKLPQIQQVRKNILTVVTNVYVYLIERINLQEVRHNYI